MSSLLTAPPRRARTSAPVPDLRPEPVRWSRPPTAYAGMLPLPLDPLDASAPCAGTEHTPEPDPFIQALLRALIDTIAGRRAANQLTRWVDDEVYADLLLRARLHQRRPVPLALRSFRAQPVAEDVWEVSARVQAGDRFTAAAIRLERAGTRWVCTVADFGPLAPAVPEPPPRLSGQRRAQRRV